MNEQFLSFRVLFRININLINMKEVQRNILLQKENFKKILYFHKEALFMLLFHKEFILYKNILERWKLSEFNAYFEKNLVEEYILNVLALVENQ